MNSSSNYEFLSKLSKRNYSPSPTLDGDNLQFCDNSFLSEIEKVIVSPFLYSNEPSLESNQIIKKHKVIHVFCETGYSYKLPSHYINLVPLISIRIKWIFAFVKSVIGQVNLIPSRNIEFDKTLQFSLYSININNYINSFSFISYKHEKNRIEANINYFQLNYNLVYEVCHDKNKYCVELYTVNSLSNIKMESILNYPFCYSNVPINNPLTIFHDNRFFLNLTFSLPSISIVPKHVKKSISNYPFIEVRRTLQLNLLNHIRSTKDVSLNQTSHLIALPTKNKSKINVLDNMELSNLSSYTDLHKTPLNYKLCRRPISSISKEFVETTCANELSISSCLNTSSYFEEKLYLKDLLITKIFNKILNYIQDYLLRIPIKVFVKQFKTNLKEISLSSISKPIHDYKSNYKNQYHNKRMECGDNMTINNITIDKYRPYIPTNKINNNKRRNSIRRSNLQSRMHSQSTSTTLIQTDQIKKRIDKFLLNYELNKQNHKRTSTMSFCINRNMNNGYMSGSESIKSINTVLLDHYVNRKRLRSNFISTINDKLTNDKTYRKYFNKKFPHMKNLGFNTENSVIVLSLSQHYCENNRRIIESYRSTRNLSSTESVLKSRHRSRSSA